jgi:threonine dehydrogenase-like Zn-dependent dehydrogenase
MGDGQGAGRANWSVGDRVVPANSAPCGGCFFCKNNQENLCEDLLFLNGAYAESIVVPARHRPKKSAAPETGNGFPRRRAHRTARVRRAGRGRFENCAPGKMF